METQVMTKYEIPLLFFSPCID